MVSVFELANLSAMAYDSLRARFHSWYRRERYGDRNGKGFFAEAYRNDIKSELVIAIRGTDLEEKDWRDVIADIQIASGRVPYQLKEALRTYDKEIAIAKKDNLKFYLTGHSLGGAIASLVAAENGGIPAVTFNAPGMLRTFVTSHFIGLFSLIKYQNLNKSKFLHIRATGDPISVGTGPHMGKVEDVYVDIWGDGKILGTSRHLAQHSIDNMITSLKTRSWYHKDLKFD